MADSTPPSVRTFRDWPPGQADPRTAREMALALAVSKIGEKEQGGKNKGPIVDWCLEGLTTREAGDWAQWCAYFVGQCVRRVLLASGQRELAALWGEHHRDRPRIFSGEAGKLLRNLRMQDWAWRPGEPLPRALCLQGPEAEGIPGPGDLVFYGEEILGQPDIAHVDFYEAAIDGGLGGFYSVGGNTGEKCDRVDRCKHDTEKKIARVMAFARVPW